MTDKINPLDYIKIVLVSPSHGGNIGAVARAMMTMGLSNLALVDPKKFPDTLATQMAAGAVSLLDNACVFATLKEALSDVTEVIGASSRNRAIDLPLYDPESLAKHTQAKSAQSIAIVFGCERHGLSNRQMSLCQGHVIVPTNQSYQSLNLSQAVQIICYELRKVLLNENVSKITKKTELASQSDVEGFYNQLEHALVSSHFLDPLKPKRLMPKIRRLFARTTLERDEVNILRGIIRALSKDKSKDKVH